MKNKVWAIGILVAGTLASNAAQANPMWTQMPGLATQIGVGAVDYPFILDINNHVQYGRNVLVKVGGINVINLQWVDTGGIGTKLTVNLNNVPYVETSANRTYGYNGTSWVSFPVLTFPNGAAACMSSFVVSYEVSQPQLVFPSSQSISSASIANLWGTDCNVAPALWQLNVNLVANPFGVTYGSTQWFQIDSGDTQVALFSTSVGSSVSQNPWVTYTPNGFAYAWNGSTMVAMPKPWFNSKNVTWLSDGYALAGNQVWRWNGSIYGSPGTGLPWIPVSGSPPPGVTLAKIAASGTLPGTNVTSHIWALDTNGNIYRLDDDNGGAPPK